MSGILSGIAFIFPLIIESIGGDGGTANQLKLQSYITLMCNLTKNQDACALHVAHDFGN